MLNNLCVNLLLLAVAGNIAPGVRGAEIVAIIMQRSLLWSQHFCLTWDAFSLRLHQGGCGPVININKQWELIPADDGFFQMQMNFAPDRRCIKASSSALGSDFELPAGACGSNALTKFKWTPEGKIQLYGGNCIGHKLKVVSCNPPLPFPEYISYDLQWSKTVDQQTPITVQLRSEVEPKEWCITWNNYIPNLWRNCADQNKQWSLILNPDGYTFLL